MLPSIPRKILRSKAPLTPFRHNSKRFFTLLGLETSADDTCAAVVTSEGAILSNVVVKQLSEHAEFGGIHPYVAIQTHQRNMPGVIRKALEDAKLGMTDVDGIAFTRGPGIGGCLGVCSTSAKVLGAALNKPIIGVHHMQAHALTSLIPSLYTPSSREKPPRFPFLTLLVSGGHTLLLLATSLDKFKILATTSDISIGRAFDQVAKILGIKPTEKGHGAALEAFCAQHDPQSPPPDPEDVPDIPLPMPGKLAFSYGGVHSTVERFVRSRGGIENVDDATRRYVAGEFQRVAVKQLESKLVLALRRCRREYVDVHDVVVSGGVASNAFLRRRLRACLDEVQSDQKINLVFPPPHLCTDNAVMIAWAAMHRFSRNNFDPYDVALRAKWSVEDLDS